MLLYLITSCKTKPRILIKVLISLKGIIIKAKLFAKDDRKIPLLIVITFS